MVCLNFLSLFASLPPTYHSSIHMLTQSLPSIPFIHLFLPSIQQSMYSFFSVLDAAHQVLWMHHTLPCLPLHVHSALYSGSKVGDIALLDVPSGKLRQTVRGAHSAPLYSMHLLGERLVATGDDAGWIKVIDYLSIAMLTNSSCFLSA